MPNRWRLSITAGQQRVPCSGTPQDQTLKWSHPSAWLLDRFAPEIYAAARRGADNALSQLLIAMLHQHPGYSITDVVEQLQGDEDVLRAAAEEVPALLQSAGSGAPTLVVGVEFWRTMLDAPRRVVPTIVLEGVGRWAFVDGLDTDQWLTYTHRTLQLTDGRIEYPIEVAERAGTAAAQDTTLQDTTLQAFTLLIGKGSRGSEVVSLTSQSRRSAGQRDDAAPPPSTTYGHVYSSWGATRSPPARALTVRPDASDLLDVDQAAGSAHSAPRATVGWLGCFLPPTGWLRHSVSLAVARPRRGSTKA
jgi:hypothetical protein